MIISKAELLMLLEWLWAVGNNIDIQEKSISNSIIYPSDELILEALLLIESQSYVKEDFDELYFILGYLNIWYQKVINSDFDYYYWEYS